VVRSLLVKKSSPGTFNVTFNVNNSVIPVVSSYRDLGVTISSDLAPSLHITDLVGKANMILRCFVSRNAYLLTRAYLCSSVTRI